MSLAGQFGVDAAIFARTDRGGLNGGLDVGKAEGYDVGNTGPGNSVLP